MKNGSNLATARDRLLHTLHLFEEVPDDTKVIVPLSHVTFTMPGVQVEESHLTVTDLRELLHGLDGDDDWTDPHDWQAGPGGIGLRCAQCELLRKNWSGRGCPGSPEALKGSMYW